MAINTTCIGICDIHKMYKKHRLHSLQGEGQKFESSNAQIKGVTLVAPFFIAKRC